MFDKNGTILNECDKHNVILFYGGHPLTECPGCFPIKEPEDTTELHKVMDAVTDAIGQSLPAMP